MWCKLPWWSDPELASNWCTWASFFHHMVFVPVFRPSDWWRWTSLLGYHGNRTKKWCSSGFYFTHWMFYYWQVKSMKLPLAATSCFVCFNVFNFVVIIRIIDFLNWNSSYPTYSCPHTLKMKSRSPGRCSDLGKTLRSHLIKHISSTTFYYIYFSGKHVSRLFLIKNHEPLLYEKIICNYELWFGFYADWHQ